MYSCIVEEYGIVQGREYFGILAVTVAFVTVELSGVPGET
jgi:hypothetical protein